MGKVLVKGRRADALDQQLFPFSPTGDIISDAYEGYGLRSGDDGSGPASLAADPKPRRLYNQQPNQKKPVAPGLNPLFTGRPIEMEGHRGGPQRPLTTMDDWSATPQLRGTGSFMSPQSIERLKQGLGPKPIMTSFDGPIEMAMRLLKGVKPHRQKVLPAGADKHLKLQSWANKQAFAEKLLGDEATARRDALMREAVANPEKHGLSFVDGEPIPFDDVPEQQNLPSGQRTLDDY